VYSRERNRKNHNPNKLPHDEPAQSSPNKRFVTISRINILKELENRTELSHKKSARLQKREKKQKLPRKKEHNYSTEKAKETRVNGKQRQEESADAAIMH